MPMTPSVAQQLKKEFELHKQSDGARLPFSPSLEVNLSLRKLVRTLESRRQTSGALSDAEQKLLKEIDKLVAAIADYNQKISQKRDAPKSNIELVYNLQGGEAYESQDPDLPLFIPRITDTQANQIISAIDKQFEEKVLKKIKPQIYRNTQSRIFPINQESAGAGEPLAGRNLSDYISVVRAERPDVPFLDEDSHKDLSKFSHKTS